MTHCQDEIMPGIWWLRPSPRGFLSDETLPRLRAPVLLQVSTTFPPRVCKPGDQVHFVTTLIRELTPFLRRVKGVNVTLCYELSDCKEGSLLGLKGPCNSESTPANLISKTSATRPIEVWGEGTGCRKAV